MSYSNTLLRTAQTIHELKSLENSAWQYAPTFSRKGEKIQLHGLGRLGHCIAWIMNALGMRTSQDVFKSWMEQITASYSQEVAPLSCDREVVKKDIPILNQAFKILRSFSERPTKLEGDLYASLKGAEKDELEAYMASYRKWEKGEPLELADVERLIQYQDKVTQLQAHPLNQYPVRHVPKEILKSLRDRVDHLEVTRYREACLEGAKRQVQTVLERKARVEKSFLKEVRKTPRLIKGVPFALSFIKDVGSYPIVLAGKQLIPDSSNKPKSIDKQIKALLGPNNEDWVHPIQTFCSQMMINQLSDIFDMANNKGIMVKLPSCQDHSLQMIEKGRKLFIKVEKAEDGTVTKVTFSTFVSSEICRRTGNNVYEPIEDFIGIQQSCVLSKTQLGRWKISEYQAKTEASSTSALESLMVESQPSVSMDDELP